MVILIIVLLYGGILLTGLFGYKGFMINTAILLTVLLLNNRLLLEKEHLTIIGIAVVISLLAKLMEDISKKKYDPLPVREFLVGGISTGLLAGILLTPLLTGAVLGLTIGMPVLRRYSRYGLKSMLITFGGWFIRLATAFFLNIWVLLKIV